MFLYVALFTGSHELGDADIDIACHPRSRSSPSLEINTSSDTLQIVVGVSAVLLVPAGPPEEIVVILTALEHIGPSLP